MRETGDFGHDSLGRRLALLFLLYLLVEQLMNNRCRPLDA